MFLLVPAYPGCPGSKAVKRSLLLLLLVPCSQILLRGVSKVPGQEKCHFLASRRDALTYDSLTRTHSDDAILRINNKLIAKLQFSRFISPFF